ncbi:DUF4193 family protein [Mycolicibacterium elephantis]|nr:DUF4193 family protein [Mycolicibacterium elephantis]MCV7221507.1 DUF4193 family protein [Mycolicibacterium elephantis]
MGATRTRRKSGTLLTDATASLPMDSGESILGELLPGHGRAATRFVVDETEEPDAAGLLALDSSELIADDMIVPVIPKRADEFTCSTCFLIHHISRLATSADGQSTCAECA